MKVLVSDYDQTLYTSDEDIKNNIEIIKEFMKSGNKFILATGRSYLDLKKVFDKYNFKCDYILLNHGSTIIDNNNNVISNTFINNEIIKYLKEDLLLDKSIRNFCCSSLESRVSFEYKNISKINIKYKAKEEANKIVKTILDKYSNFVNAYQVSDSTVEIISNEINKAKGIQILSNILNIKKEDIYTIGDGYSDIEMVKSYKGYCMKNSIDELKEVALKQYDSVYELVNELNKEIIC